MNLQLVPTGTMQAGRPERERIVAELDVKSEIAGTVASVEVQPGQEVAADAELMILVSMKMEIPILAPRGGTVRSVRVSPDDTVQEGQSLVLLEV